MVGNQHPVQRPRGGDKLLPRARKNKFFNQRIDRRVFNADIIAPAGGRNYIGIKDAAVDALIEKLIFARSRQELVTATRALDRVLISNHYIMPEWHSRQ